jgi:hypothetical protein
MILEGPAFLSCIITSSGTWMHHYTTELKAKSTEWKQTTLPTKKKFKRQKSARKVLLTALWLGAEHYYDKLMHLKEAV